MSSASAVQIQDSMRGAEVDDPSVGLEKVTLRGDDRSDLFDHVHETIASG